MKIKVLIIVTMFLGVFAMSLYSQNTKLKQEITEYKSKAEASEVEANRLKSIVNYLTTQKPTVSEPSPIHGDTPVATPPAYGGGGATSEPGVQAVPPLYNYSVPDSGMSSGIMMEENITGASAGLSEPRTN